MKKITVTLCMLILMACGSSETSAYTKSEAKQLENFGVLNQAENDCENTKSVKSMLKGTFKKEYTKRYCSLKIEKADGVNELIEKDASNKVIQEYIRIPYFKEKNIDRYLASKEKKIKDKVLNVNMDLDLDPYAKTNSIEGESIDMLVNKYNALPEGYIPSDLVDIQSVCDIETDFSCSTMAKQQLRKSAAKAFESFVDAAKQKKLDIVAIASYRSYEYQAGLYDYNLGQSGREYADQYYARPGQSEHNSGLAVDITFNGYNYNEIETKEGYDWILKNMHKYGFILRYPEAKTSITQYGYESWHLRYVGKTLATKLYKENITLEEYYGMK